MGHSGVIRAPKIGGRGTRAGSLAQNALLKPRQVGGHVRGLAAGRTRRRTNHGLGINAMYGQVRFEEVVLTLKSVTRIFRPAPCLNSTAPTCQMLVMPWFGGLKIKDNEVHTSAAPWLARWCTVKIIRFSRDDRRREANKPDQYGSGVFAAKPHQDSRRAP
jgi:hypothetical protein